MNFYKNEVIARLEIAAALVETSAKQNAPKDLGALANSIYHEVDQTNLKAFVIANTPYALIQEVGGVIVPDKAGALTVPIDPEAKHKRASDFPDLFMIKRDGKPPLLARNVGKDLQVMFVLVSRVQIPAQPYLRPALESNKQKIMKLFAQ